MRTGLTTAALTLIPAAAFAHTGAGELHGFVWGFAHPLGGLDHILAMVTVGIFAWQLGGRALWLVPATFVLVMAAGATLGIARLPLPFVEFGIAASFIVLGGMTLSPAALRSPSPWGSSDCLRSSTATPTAPRWRSMPRAAPMRQASCWRPRSSTSPVSGSAARSAASLTVVPATGSAARSSHSRAWRS